MSSFPQRVLWLVFFLSSLPMNTQAQEAPTPVTLEASPMPAKENVGGGTSHIEFADHLFADGDFYRAITEYRRYLFQVKGQGDAAARAACAIGEALYRGGQFEAAAVQWDEVAQRAQASGLRWQALFSAGLAYLTAEQSFAAKPRFRLIAEDESAPALLRAHAQWFLAWGHLDAGEIELARMVLGGLIASEGPLHEQAQGLHSAIAPEALPKGKSPLMAGLLSAIPGLGHFYLGQWQTGFTSMLWSGVLLAGAGYSAYTQDYVVAGALAVIGLGWYSGGAYGAISGAMQHNRDQIHNWREKILFKHGASRQLPDLRSLQENGTFAPGTYPQLGIKLAPTSPDGVE
ncbi:MAG: hypothetical protein CMH56_00060 [Myxococcales bacterium]|nr:hypothetical protein [Myxococcales bacterium]